MVEPFPPDPLFKIIRLLGSGLDLDDRPASLIELQKSLEGGGAIAFAPLLRGKSKIIKKNFVLIGNGYGKAEKLAVFFYGKKIGKSLPAFLANDLERFSFVL